MNKKRKVKILDIIYEKQCNLFQLKVKEIEGQKEVVLAIKGTDWGVTPDISDEIIENFCNEMKGKEKNLLIEVDNFSISEERKVKENKDELIPQEKLDSINRNIDEYPIDEIMNSITLKEENEN